MEAGKANGPAAKVSHVNLMTDTMIANLSPDALRVVLRSMLAADENGQLTNKLQHHVQKYLQHDLQKTSIPALFSATENSSSASSTPTPELAKLRSLSSSLLGSGLPFESLQLLAAVVRQSQGLSPNEISPGGRQLVAVLAAVDGDLVQALTAVQKIATISSGGKGRMSTDERQVLLSLRADLEDCKRQSEGKDAEFMFERGSTMLDSVLSTVPK
ncbi:hypothetical protein AJ79_08895 [Helicocarpus griseus UAMH5409]|uniref:Uncharacterized protein n=1 Tax=Helicocarpus griseus UAMH5409 TaxID=1447875 RepID=A0A2B7WPH3_9EURO|nr:hypothetical protein AJ79_08895 [Helicocarpus griseus UAMH5409]